MTNQALLMGHVLARVSGFGSCKTLRGDENLPQAGGTGRSRERGMQSVFLSQHFEETDRDLVDTVQTLIESYGLMILRGDAVGGGPVSPGVEKRIRQADACIALATPREAGKRTTYPWVFGEVVMAYTASKLCAVIVEKSVEIEGPFSENEKILYDPVRPLPMIKKLARTIWGWRQEAGRQMKALVLPETVAAELARNAGRARCEYRYYDARGRAGEWRPAALVPLQGGPVLYLDGVREENLVEVRVNIGRQSWSSKASAPLAHVKLVKETRA
jgi:hypothetical protein